MAPQASTPPRPYIRLFQILKHYPADVLFGVTMLLATKITEAAVVPLLQGAINQFTTRPPTFSELTETTLLPIFLLALAMLVTRILSRVFLFGMGRKVEHDVRNQLFRHLLKLPPYYHQVTPVGEVMSRLTNDITAIRYLTGGGTLLGLNTVFTYALYLPMMFQLSVPLSLVYCVLLPISLGLMAMFSRWVKTHFKDVQDTIGDISAMAQENLSGISVIQAYAKEDIELKRFEGLSRRYKDAYRALIRNRIWLYLIMALGGGLGLLAILWEGGREIQTHQLTLGAFVAFIIMLERVTWPTMAMGWVISMFQQGFAAIERVDEVLTAPLTQGHGLQSPPEESPEKSPEEDSLVHPPDTTAPTLTLQDLTFRYHNPYAPQNTSAESNAPPQTAPLRHEFSLTDLSLTIAPGETLAIVGPVGSGKTTLLALLTGLYPVPPGMIFLNGQDIQDIPPSQLRRQVAWMPQSSFLFSRTVTENFAFARSAPIDEDEIITMAQDVQLHPDLAALPQGYQTVVGERGLSLSGGQRQRFSLGRALLRSAPVLLLDDPFSHLDAGIEANILTMLQERKALQGKTTLITTHRFSILSQVDRVLFLDHGRIQGLGPHKELLATNPHYAAFVSQPTEAEEASLPQGPAPDDLAWEATP